MRMASSRLLLQLVLLNNGIIQKSVSNLLDILNAQTSIKNIAPPGLHMLKTRDTQNLGPSQHTLRQRICYPWQTKHINRVSLNLTQRRSRFIRLKDTSLLNDRIGKKLLCKLRELGVRKVAGEVIEL